MWCGRVLVRKDVVGNVAIFIICEILIFQIREGALPLVVVVVAVVGVAREVVVVIIRVVVKILVESVGLLLGRVELREGVVVFSSGGCLLYTSPSPRD